MNISLHPVLFQKYVLTPFLDKESSYKEEPDFQLAYAQRKIKFNFQISSCLCLKGGVVSSYTKVWHFCSCASLAPFNWGLLSQQVGPAVLVKLQCD